MKLKIEAILITITVIGSHFNSCQAQNETTTAMSSTLDTTTQTETTTTETETTTTESTTSTTTSTTTTTMGITLEPSPTQVPTVSCGSTPCNGYGYYYSDAYVTIVQRRCIWPNHYVQYCDTVAGSWINVNPASSMIYIPCHGNLTFTVGATARYWLSDTTLYEWTGSTWNVTKNSAAFPLGQFGARFRPGEASGSFFCWFTGSTSPSLLAGATNVTTTVAYYYNGTYYDVGVDGNSYLVMLPQAIPQSAYYLLPWSTSYEDGCKSPLCCWVTDLVSVTPGTPPVTTEIKYDGANWYVWSSGSYHLYTGPTSYGISGCIGNFSNQTFRLDDGTQYQWINNSIYQLTQVGKPIAANQYSYSDMSSYLDYDPAATGGYYVPYAGTVGRFANASGSFLYSFASGVVQFRRPDATCDAGYRWLSMSGPQCGATSDWMHVPDFIACDPAASRCDTGYKCVTFPAEAFTFTPSCSMGFCVPDYASVCGPTTTMSSTTGSTSTTSTTSSTSTTTSTTTLSTETTSPTSTISTTSPTTTTAIPLPTSNLLKFGSRCQVNADCYTGICNATIGKCSCTNCTRVLPSFAYNWRTGLFSYMEQCIPTTSVIAGLGEPCNVWADVKSTYCGLGMFCGKCPEHWSCKFSNGTCIALNISQNACPSTYKCGYKANCTMVGGVPTCVCQQAGYNLEPNMMDCYGWTGAYASRCSVSCGNGFATVTRTCDRSPTSTINCEGAVTYKTGCDGGLMCPLAPAIAPAACYVGIQTNAVTVSIFNSMLQSSLQTTIASALTKRCLSDNTTFETECCPGKAWSAKLVGDDCINGDHGVTFLNKHTDGSVLSFYVTAKVDDTSVCCKTAAVKIYHRRKRTATDGYLSSSTIASVLSTPAVTNDVQSVVQTVDPAAYIPTGSVNQATTSTSAYPNALYYGATVAAGSLGSLQMETIGIIAGCGAFFIIIVVTVVIVLLQKRKIANAHRLKVSPVNSAANHQPLEQMEMTGNGYPPQQVANSPVNQQPAIITDQRPQDDSNVVNKSAVAVQNATVLAYPAYFGRHPMSSQPNDAAGRRH